MHVLIFTTLRALQNHFGMELSEILTYHKVIKFYTLDEDWETIIDQYVIYDELLWAISRTWQDLYIDWFHEALISLENIETEYDKFEFTDFINDLYHEWEISLYYVK